MPGTNMLNFIICKPEFLVMDGISCVKQIREFEAQGGLKRTPIIIQTG
jgi:CheY-like chemotaxis protein